MSQRHPFREAASQRIGANPCDRRIHVALPIRVTLWDDKRQPKVEVACTYDISPRGARLGGLRMVQRVGEVLTLERGRQRTMCRVVWIGAPGSEMRGQVGVQCVEREKLLWEPELREIGELFDFLPSGPVPPRNGGRIQRRSARFQAEGDVSFWRSETGSDFADVQMSGELEDLSEIGCKVRTRVTMAEGAKLHMAMNLPDYEFVMRGLVRYSMPDSGLGIEFIEIRKGDRRLLRYALQKLAQREAAIPPAPVSEDITAEALAG